MTKRISRANCLGIIIDVQEFFLRDLDGGERARIEAGAAEFARLLSCLKIPLMFTVERPLEKKGGLAESLAPLGARSEIAEKDFFDLTKEPEIKKRLVDFDRRQVIVCGCETDVCVLQSCLGLIELGYEVYVVEDLLFSSTKNVEAAAARLRAEGAVFLTLKTLFHELAEAVEGSPHRKELGI